ncbi:MAG TPA: phospholipase D-like domain-containing protein [Caulobacteraceae bacterium]|nr:phospholipase D-like domain-containing protein [Caulobacteraceae bacterium]
MALLEPGETCWRIDRAHRAAFLIDAQAYFSAVREALAAAQRSVFLLGWAFDPRTRLAPDGMESGHEPDQIGQMLIDLAAKRPELDIRLLIWRSALPIALTQEFFPHRARNWFEGSGIKFRLDDETPLAACHHQKALVVDDQLAFCGGADFGVDRWDTTAHLDVDYRRIDPDHTAHPPRHEVMALVDGPAAQALGDLARERWRRATGEVLTPPIAGGDPWPPSVVPELGEVGVGLARTEPAWHGRPAVREWEALTLRSIAEAKRSLYIENQYFTAPSVAEALARRLAEPKGPEIVLVTSERSPSYFDRFTMDRARGVALRRLREADVFGRFRALHPVTAEGRPIIVHAKLMLVDDRLARIGSGNLNNRSGGLDTECEVAIEAKDRDGRAAIARLRHRLIAHYLGRTADDLDGALARSRSLIRAIEALNRNGRLKDIAAPTTGRLTRLVASYHLGDPLGVEDAWRPWRRKKMLDRAVHAIAARKIQAS